MNHLKIASVKKSYGRVDVLKGIDLEITAGEFTVFVGPSGCGKSTLLRSIAGLESISGGTIHLGDKRIDKLEPADRGVAMVFQNYALYPHMTVDENMSFGLRLARTPKATIRDKIKNAADILRIGDYLDRKPKALSGGQRQRVAIGRAIVRKPELFLFDEPLSNLDAKLRVQMRLELSKLHRQLGATMIYVTHDQVEAMTMADKIVILNDGRIEQIGRPLDLYNHPRNMFVAGFIGSPGMNFLRASVTDVSAGAISVAAESGVKLSIPLSRPSRAQPRDEVTLGVRPDDLRLDPAGGGSILAMVDAVERLGSDTYVYAKLQSGEAIALHVSGDHAVNFGETVAVGVNTPSCHLFDRDGVSLTSD